MKYSRKRIDDGLPSALSRQRRYQIRNSKIGLCTVCGRDSEPFELCKTHRIKKAARMRLWYQKKRAEKRNVRDEQREAKDSVA